MDKKTTKIKKKKDASNSLKNKSTAKVRTKKNQNNQFQTEWDGLKNLKIKWSEPIIAAKTLSKLNLGLIEILIEIKKNPQINTYSLAHKLNKAQPYVQKQIQWLVQNNLIEVEKVFHNGRRTNRLSVPYGYLTLEVMF